MATTAVFAGLALLVIVCDARERRVPNWLNFLILVTGLGWRAATGGADGTLAGAAGAGVGLLVLALPFAARWTGGGDLKLLAAMGAWLGAEHTVYAGLLGLGGAGLWAVALLAGSGAELRRSVVRNLSAAALTATAPQAPARSKGQTIPVAIPLAVAAVAVFGFFGVGGMP
jgi:prepilin peptidase CpaA